MHYLSQASIDQYEREREELKARLCGHKEDKTGCGDFASSMNGDRHADMEVILQTEGTTAHRLEQVIGYLTGVVPAPAPKQCNTAAPGHLIKLGKNGSESFTVYLCYPNEADIYDNVKLTSSISPLGTQLLGSEVGDKISIRTARGEVKYKVEAILIPDAETLHQKQPQQYVTANAA